MNIEINKKLSEKELLVKEIEILRSYKGLAKASAEKKLVELEKKLAAMGGAPEKKAEQPTTQAAKQDVQAVADPTKAKQTEGQQAVADPEKAKHAEGEQAVVDPSTKKKSVVATPAKGKKK